MIMSKLSWSHVLCASLIWAGISFHATSADAQSSRYRRVRNGVGNCIFSTSPLPHRRESRYRNIRKSFKVKPGLVIYARCYVPKKFKHYERIGRIYNQLRNHRKSQSMWWYGASYKRAIRVVKHPYRAKHRNWDQNSYIFGRRRGCNYCKDFIQHAKRLWIKPWEKPRTFCVRKSILYAHRYKRKWKFVRGGVRQARDLKLKIFFKGCFTLRYPKP